MAIGGRGLDTLFPKMPGAATATPYLMVWVLERARRARGATRVSNADT